MTYRLHVDHFFEEYDVKQSGTMPVRTFKQAVRRCFVKQSFTEEELTTLTKVRYDHFTGSI